MQRNRVLEAGMVVHLGQRLGAVVAGNAVYPFQDVVDVGLDQKAAGADFLGGVAEGIEPEQLDAARRKKLDVALHQDVGLGRAVVQVDLVLGEGAPDPAGRAVGKSHLAKRLFFLADMDAGQVVGRDRPEPVDMHEQVGILGGIALGQEVLEFLGLVGNVIQRQVQAQVKAAGDFLDVGPAAVLGVDLLVGQRRKPAIGIRQVRRQDVHAADDV